MQKRISVLFVTNGWEVKYLLSLLFLPSQENDRMARTQKAKESVTLPVPSPAVPQPKLRCHLCQAE